MERTYTRYQYRQSDRQKTAMNRRIAATNKQMWRILIIRLLSFCIHLIASQSRALFEWPWREAMDSLTPSVNVLLVENDSSVADAAAMFLESIGHKVRRATSGTHALSVVADLGIPEFVLTGLRLNGTLDGVDLVKRLRVDANRIIPAIIMTGDTSSISRERVERLALCSLHIKPFDCTILANALENPVISKILPFKCS
jgi:CheY-like chemotaxis protein